MSETVADAMWSMLASAGVRRCYGIVGDALNPVVDALRRDGRIEFVHVRNEEAGVFAAVAEASLTGELVAVCGTSGPGVMHLLNGLMDAQREGVPVIAIPTTAGTGSEVTRVTVITDSTTHTKMMILDGKLVPGRDWRMEVTDEFQNTLYVLLIQAQKPK